MTFSFLEIDPLKKVKFFYLARASTVFPEPKKNLKTRISSDYKISSSAPQIRVLFTPQFSSLTNSQNSGVII